MEIRYRGFRKARLKDSPNSHCTKVSLYHSDLWFITLSIQKNTCSYYTELCPGLEIMTSLQIRIVDTATCPLDKKRVQIWSSLCTSKTCRRSGSTR